MTLTRPPALDWMNDAACRAAIEAGTANEDWWFPTPIGKAGNPTPAPDSRAIRICLGCPVRRSCLVYSFHTSRSDDHHVYGGYSARARRRLRSGATSPATEFHKARHKARQARDAVVIPLRRPRRSTGQHSAQGGQPA